MCKAPLIVSLGRSAISKEEQKIKKKVYMKEIIILSMVFHRDNFSNL